MFKKIVKQAAVFLFPIVLIISCQTNNQCDTATESLVKVNFYVVDSVELAVTVSNISVYGLGNSDSLLYENDTTRSSVLLPLSPNSETTEFVFEFENITENIKFTYTTSTYLESMDCGFITNYEIESVGYSKNIIDTIIIINGSVTTDNEEHIKLFFVNNNPNK